MFLKFLEIHRKKSALNSLFNKISRLSLRQAFSCEFCKIFKNMFYTRHLWETVSDLAHLEVIGSNEGITVLINVIIRLYNPLVKAFYNSVKDWYLFCKAHIWSLICWEDTWHYVPLSGRVFIFSFCKKTLFPAKITFIRTIPTPTCFNQKCVCYI